MANLVGLQSVCLANQNCVFSKRFRRNYVCHAHSLTLPFSLILQWLLGTVTLSQLPWSIEADTAQLSVPPSRVSLLATEASNELGCCLCVVELEVYQWCVEIGQRGRGKRVLSSYGGQFIGVIIASCGAHWPCELCMRLLP